MCLHPQGLIYKRTACFHPLNLPNLFIEPFFNLVELIDIKNFFLKGHLVMMGSSKNTVRDAKCKKR